MITAPKIPRAKLEGSLTLIAARERCQMCHGVCAVGFQVHGRVWEAVVHPRWQASILCLRCFTSMADEKLFPWDGEITFYPLSLAKQHGLDRAEGRS